MSRRRPTSTPFPYTTLFRSLESRRAHPEQLYTELARLGGALCTFSLDSDPRARRCTRDRKSTRLNSSHQIISYAVFCLKKKNRETPRSGPPPLQLACQPLDT